MVVHSELERGGASGNVRISQPGARSFSWSKVDRVRVVARGTLLSFTGLLEHTYTAKKLLKLSRICVAPLKTAISASDPSLLTNRRLFDRAAKVYTENSML